jgi:predicted nucleic acid-binding protein
VAQVEALDLDEAVAARAGELAATLGLRGADAVHLASYETLEGEESMLVSADGALAIAARTLGHSVAVPA